MHFTIQDFSKRTGLPPSKLRFYDKKGILQPTRLENGYRVYTPEQIHDAKMIDSLRNANISILDIKRYSEADLSEKNIMLERWKQELDNKIEVLHAARKYVAGIKAEKPHSILLTKWEKSKALVWQEFEVARVPHPFKECFVIVKSTLEAKRIDHSETVYVRTKGINGDRIIGEIGFEVSNTYKDVDGFTFERYPSTLFAMMEDCQSDDDFLCFSYLQMVIRYGFQPDGYKLERYANIQAETFDYLIPLVK